MNPVTAFFDDVVKLVDSGLAAIVQFAGGSRPESTCIYGEYQCLEYWIEIGIERTIYEYIVRR